MFRHISNNNQWSIGIRDTQGTVRTLLNFELVLFSRWIFMYHMALGAEVAVLNS